MAPITTDSDLPMRRFLAAFAALAILCATNAARAQGANSTVSFTYERSTLGPEKPESPDAKDSLGIQTFRFRAGSPIPLGRSTLLLTGLAYDLIDFPKSTSHGLPTSALHAPTLSLGIMQLFGAHVVISATINGGFASDFKDRISMDDVAFGASGAAIYKFSDTFSLGAGVSYSQQTRRFFPFPIIALNWQMGQRFRINGSIPALLNVEYRPASSITFGIRGAFEANVFHVSKQSLRVLRRRNIQARWILTVRHHARGPTLVRVRRVARQAIGVTRMLSRANHSAGGTAPSPSTVVHSRIRKRWTSPFVT